MGLILLFVLLPVVELWLLIRVGTVLGPANTIALVIGTGILGASLARSQGLAVLQRMQTEMRAGQPPAATVMEGVAILLAGIVLLTPGLITDVLGFLLLIPPTRKLLLAGITKRLQQSMQSGGGPHVFMGGARGPRPGGPQPPGDGPGIKSVPFVDVTGKRGDGRDADESRDNADGDRSPDDTPNG